MTTNLNFKKWDVRTVTASDFTVEMDITVGMWTWYNKELNNNPIGTLDFEEYLRDKLEKHVTSLPPIFSQKENIKIACISFGYKNASLINLLTKRGSMIANGRFKKLAGVDFCV